MIARTPAGWQPESWQRELAEGYRLPAELLAALGLDAAMHADVDFDPHNPFPQRVPLSYVQRMRRGDPSDPLLRQVLPLLSERAPSPAGYGRDPVGDLDAALAPGVLHKYQGRALLIATGACAVHCRYCFRRHFPYADAPGASEWKSALATLTDHKDVYEIILSGGDPLALTTHRLAALIERITVLPQLRRLRLHTRLPVVLPARIDQALLTLLANTRLKTVMVIHANHANEIDTQVRSALVELATAGVTLLNQSVLLQGVNDDAAALAALSEALFDAGVTPYYLHLLDRVEGSAHFEVPTHEALQIHAQLRALLPGYLVPRLVREEPGAPAKTPVF
ncbi:MAG: EF-P beta-lysylation protein EpmB [Chromatiales bacterium]|nr:EF-P beta-lysylation protein EpmB [Chromatiales bacterium]